MTEGACPAYDAQKVEVVFTTDSRAQDGTPIETPHFSSGGRTITRHEFASLYERETSSTDVDQYKVADDYGFTVVGLAMLGVGVAAAATGGVLLLATEPSSGAHTAGWVTLIAGLALWAPSPWLIMAGSSKEQSGYAFDAPTARALADAYNRALERRLDQTCGATKSPAARLSPAVTPTFTGLVVRF